MRPPVEELNFKYRLGLTNYAYAEKFIKMITALIDHNVSFTAPILEDVLEYLTGEAHLSVNKFSGARWGTFDYIPGEEECEKYFNYIKWKKLKSPKFSTSKKTI
ncbi:hypothetical protein AKJ44_01090 [candidate division MSBL1 archaeon SCGC-AAA261F17]|uniref:Uncharacterized protein n=1 Tax=candidate division MSBL1 archaeon SCGC-AAA261F17 TaxID=1698274 RepID=A0A133V6Y8_9EURY|nr:hypothetical protein AKJ44_01090 [candidate division MSBL1 archaeon SCGC-AAA261F17]